jgi:hypothetical protein
LVPEALMITSGGVVNAQTPARLLLLGLLVLFLAAGCAPGYNSRTGEPMSSRSELWSTVLIGVVAFVVGFLTAATMSVGGGLRRSHHHRHHTHVDWDRVSNDAAAVIRKELAEWRSAEHKEAANWDEFGHRLEDRLREELESNRE